MKRFLCFFAALAAGSALTRAQDTFSVEWSTLDGGGGPSTATGAFTLEGSIGQFAAGDSGGAPTGEFSVSSGYWTFEPEPLDGGLVMHLSGGTVSLTWNPAPPMILESSANLSLWTPVTPQPSTPFFQEPATAVRRFYRLVPGP
jgi:hypothetical protein